MSFLLSKVLWIVLQPSTLLLLLLGAGVALLWTRWRRLGRALASAAFVLSLLPALLPLFTLLAVPLENYAPPVVTLPAHVDGILVLGGAEEPAISAARRQPVLNGAAERLTAFVFLARRYPEAELVFSGGSSAISGTGSTDSSVANDVFSQLGLPASRILFEKRSRNTWENALFSRSLVDPRPDETWLLVTSAMHMPRAVGVFQKVGWHVIPYPVDYQTDGRISADTFVPSVNVLGELYGFNTVAREWLGLLAYRVMGRTTRLFPHLQVTIPASSSSERVSTSPSNFCTHLFCVSCASRACAVTDVLLGHPGANPRADPFL